jgi:multiple sugar transport system ATP-binding protein
VRFESASVNADVSGYNFAQPPLDAQAAVLGIRPEHLRQVASDAAHINTRATVGLIEPMGAYKIGWLDAQGTPLAVQVDPQAPLTSGAVVALGLDTAHLSLFDTASERRL